MITAHQSQHTSFIPKKTPKSGGVRRRKASTQLFLALGIIIFLVSGGVAGGAYVYKDFLRKEMDQIWASLEHNKSTLNTKDIAEWKRLDIRMTTLNDILGRHLAFSHFFGVLGEHTLQTVRFSTFSYEYSQDGDAEITLSGQAPDYASLVSQSDIFGSLEDIHNPIFSDLKLDDEGNVLFSVTFTVDSSLTKYDDGNHI
jgi:hypothetical protein